MKNLITLIIFAIPFLGFSQSIEEVMQEGDKINVVYTVVLVILAGFIGYLFYLDLKVKRLSKKFEDLEK